MKDVEDSHRDGLYSRRNSTASVSTLLEAIPETPPGRKIFDPCRCSDCCRGCLLEVWCRIFAFTQITAWIPTWVFYWSQFENFQAVVFHRYFTPTQEAIFLGLLGSLSLVSVISGVIFIAGIELRIKQLCLVNTVMSVIVALLFFSLLTYVYLSFTKYYTFFMAASIVFSALLLLYLFIALASYGLFTRFRAGMGKQQLVELDTVSSCASAHSESDTPIWMMRRKWIYSPIYAQGFFEGKLRSTRTKFI